MAAEYLRLVPPALLQTAVHTYCHPDTGRQVTLIGAHHVGVESYYMGLRAVIDDREAAGAVVHCEKSLRLPDGVTDVTEAEQQVLDQIRRCHELDKRRTAELGWVGQIDGLGYPPRWQIVDLTQLEIMRRTGVEVLRRQVQRMIRPFDWPDDDRRGIQRLRLRLAIGYRLLARKEQNMIKALRRQPAMAVILDERNALALNGVAGTPADVVLLWGIGHMPGLAAGLQEQGFVRVGPPQWHTVAPLPAVAATVWRLVTSRTTP